jgi:signal transduction histidine kinase
MKEAEEKLAAVNRELMVASRQAGMAEVATGVLHNVGNVLNSVNVSATLLRETLQSSEVATLGRVAELMRSRNGDLGNFLTTDPKGRLIPGLVIQLADHLAKEHAVLHAEHEQLARNVEHIKEIVAMQQSYARLSGVLEKVGIADVLDDALKINVGGLARHGVEVVREFAEVPPVTVDKHKVMQILINLIHNAKYAVDESDRADRRITLGIGLSGANRVRISVADNGVGIPPENLTRIFSRGFTTRRNGHGFGLHSGAIAAREMGGALRAESGGAGQGATFILELPIAAGGKTP